MINDDYFNSKRFKIIIQKYEDAERNGDTIYFEADDLTDIAEYYQSKGNSNKALEIVEKAIDMFPGSVAPLIFRSRIELLINNDAEGAERYADTIDDKNDLDYIYIKAEILLNKGNIEEAKRFINNSFDNIDAEEKDDFILDIADLYADYNIIGEAEKWLKMSTEVDDPDYREIAGRLAISKGEYDKSQKIFNDLIDGNPYSTKYWNQLAASQYIANDLQGSIQSSEYSIAINPNDEEAILNKANCMFTLGNYEEAIKHYTQLAIMHPNDETGEMFIGMSLIKTNNVQDAIIHLEKAEKIASANASNRQDIYQTLAYCYSSIKQQDTAIKYTFKAGNQKDAHEDELNVLRGHIMLENNDMSKAKLYFQKAIDLSNSSPNIILHIAISLFDNDYITQSYDMLSTLLDTVDEDWCDGYAYLAVCCKKMDKEDDFKKYLNIACKKNPMEIKNILGENFPIDLDAKDYYNYLTNERQ